MVVLVKAATPEAVLPVPSVLFEIVSVKVTVSPLGGAGVIVAVKVTLVPAFTDPPGAMASVVVVVVTPTLSAWPADTDAEKLASPG